LEVLAALALLAILLLCVYSGVRSATLSVGRGSAAVARIDEIRGAREFLRREIASATALPWKLDAQGVPVVFEGDTMGFTFVSVLPGYLGTLGPQVIRVAFTDKGNLAVWLSPLPTSQQSMDYGEPEPIMASVRHISVRYAKRGVPGWVNRWDDPAELPASIEVQLDAEEGSAAWPVLVLVPRQGAGAVNVRAAAISLQQQSPP
jgi:general secretion pathway protein J